MGRLLEQLASRHNIGKRRYLEEAHARRPRRLRLLLLAFAAAACGDDSAASGLPAAPERQAAGRGLHAGHRRRPEIGQGLQQPLPRLQPAREVPSKALADCNAAIKLQPRNASAYNNRGWAYEMQGSSTWRSRTTPRRSQIDPKFAVAFANRGDVYAKKGEKEKAIAEYRQALAIEPDNDVALGGLKKLGARP